MNFNWKIILGVLLGALVLGAIALGVSEWRAIQKAGGLKVWVADVPTTNYRTVRAIWLTEGIVVILSAAVLARAVWPLKVGELQTEAIYAIFAMLGVVQGLNVTAFIGKRVTANPEMVAAVAAAKKPGVLPSINTTKTTETEDKTTTETTTVVAVATPVAQPKAALPFVRDD